MRRMNVAMLLLIPIGLALPALAQVPAVNLAAFQAARKSYIEDDMAATRDRLIARAEAEPADFEAQLDAAECLRITGSELRTKRQAQQIGGKEAKNLKREQETWSSRGMVFAERALALADSEERKATVHRVYGELYANSITGMMAGLKNGPKARNHMDAALAQIPDDPECQRAMGIMYLNNPPFNGGDVNKAIATFENCHQRARDNDIYMVLLSMAYRKNQDWAGALKSAETALEINPNNPNAAALKKALTEKLESPE